MRICDACRRREESGVGGLLRLYIVRVQSPVELRPSAQPSAVAGRQGEPGELGTYELCEGCHERLIAAVRDAVDGVMNAMQEVRPEGHSGKDSLP
jgi:hypothetical protein